jgi:branched-chain amino acid transport system substrate-binding protein
VDEGVALTSILFLLLIVVLSPSGVAAQPGVGDTEIVLGGSNSFSGPLAYTGEQLTRFGVDLYFRGVNDAGGIHRRKIRTVYYDDGSRPHEALANTRKLVEQDRVFAIIVPQGSPPVVATLEYLERQKVPLLFPYQVSPVTRSRRYVFSGATLTDRSSKMTVDYLAGTRKYKRFAVLHQDDDYGNTIVAALAKDLTRFGLKLTAAESVRAGTIDVKAQITKLRAARPEVTLLALVPGPAAFALRERRKIGWTDTVMVSTGPLTDERYLGLAADAAEGVEGLSYLPDPVTSDLLAVQVYRAQMQKYFPGSEPNRYSLAGYYAAMLFTEAAMRAGRDLTRESLITALESFKGFDSGLVPPLTIGPDHETQKQGFWVRIEKGRFKPVTDWLKSE